MMSMNNFSRAASESMLQVYKKRYLLLTSKNMRACLVYEHAGYVNIQTW